MAIGSIGSCCDAIEGLLNPVAASTVSQVDHSNSFTDVCQQSPLDARFERRIIALFEPTLSLHGLR